MLELLKQNIHMNRWKNQVSTQITMDDDFIVPDTMSDMAQILLQTGEIMLESSKIQGERAMVRGKLDFHVLYRREEGGLQTLGGMIPFEEAVNIPGLEDGDYLSISWQLEDLNTGIINSRKLGVKAIVTLDVKAEVTEDKEAAVDVGNMEDAGNDAVALEVLKNKSEVAALAVRKKDTHRIKEQITLSGNKPNIGRILWTELRLRGVNTRPMDGQVHLEGELSVFVIYEGEGESAAVQWVEESLPFSGELEVPEAEEEMIPDISVQLIHKELEERPDYDGEMRELQIDGVLELDIKLYREEEVELLNDMYSTNREMELETGEASFDKILTHTTGKYKLAEKADIEGADRILQICHSTGTVKVDETEMREDTVHLEGVLEVQLLYLTDDDISPVQSVTEVLPFSYDTEVRNVTAGSVCKLETGIEQLTAVMMGGDAVEIKAVLMFELLVMQPVREQVILKAQTFPMDTNKLKQLPGIVGYIVQKGDKLWDIAKRFHTTADTIMETNGLMEAQIQPGDRIILIKELGK